MRISKLELDGIGPFDHASLEFPNPADTDPGDEGELVLFEGPNGSGKTTLLLAVALALGLFSRTDDEEPFLLTDINEPPFHWARRSRFGASFALYLQHEHELAGWHFAATQESSDVSQVKPLSYSKTIHDLLRGADDARRWAGATRWGAYSFGQRSQTPETSASGPVLIRNRYLSRALYFGGSPSREPKFPPLGQLLCNLDYEYSRAVAWSVTRDQRQPDQVNYEEVAARYKDTLNRMQHVLSQLLERQVTFDFRLGEPAPRVLFDGEAVEPEFLGEGLRSTFSWLSDLLIQLQLTEWVDKTRSPLDQDFWLLLDEVDQALHPQLQLKLMPTLRKLFPRARIYATTHSPFVVASAARGHVFTLQPDKKTYRVTGPQTPHKLEPGQTLERVVSEFFGTDPTFIDPETIARLEQHKRLLNQLRRQGQLEATSWEDFGIVRSWLLSRTDEVRTVVAMREVPVQKQISDRFKAAR